MEEVLETILYQIAGYMMAMGFSFVLFSFWQRGYFIAYLRVRTSLGKLTLVKLVGPTKIQYRVGRVEEGNLLWGKPGRDGHILNDIKREFIYKEQNVDCVDVDSISYSFIPKDVCYAKVLKPLPEDATIEDYNKVFNKDGNEIIVTAIEGFDPEKVDSLIQRAQFKPSSLNKTLHLVLLIAMITLLISGGAAVGVFIAGDSVKKNDLHIGAVEAKVDKIVKFIEEPTVTGEAKATG